MPPKRKIAESTAEVAEAVTTTEVTAIKTYTTEPLMQTPTEITLSSDCAQTSVQVSQEFGVVTQSMPQGEVVERERLEIASKTQDAENSHEVASNAIINIYSRLQEATEHDAKSVNAHIPEVLTLLQAIESNCTPLLWRVKFLELLAKIIVALNEYNSVKKIFTTLVRFIASDGNSIQTAASPPNSTNSNIANTNTCETSETVDHDNINNNSSNKLSIQLINGAIECIAALGCVTVDDKRWETFAREGADVLLQVYMDHDCFAEETRHSADKAFEQLSTHAFKAVITKLLHWMSDDREDDDAEHLFRERLCAINKLSRLVYAPSMKSYWTAEMQQHVFTLLPRVLATVDNVEFAHLSRIVCRLAMCQEQACVPLIEAILAAKPLKNVYKTTHSISSTGKSAETNETNALTSNHHYNNNNNNNNRSSSNSNVNSCAAGALLHDRALESLSMLLPHIPNSTSAEFDLVTLLQQAGYLEHDGELVSSSAAVHFARVLLIASRLATSSAAEMLLPYISDRLENILTQDANTENNEQEHTLPLPSTHVTSDACKELDTLCKDGNLKESIVNNVHHFTTSVTVIELLLLSVISLSKKQTVEVLQQLHKEEFIARMKELYEKTVRVSKLITFAVKKNRQRGSIERKDVEGEAALQNIRLITSSFMSKHIPLGEIVESYNVRVINSSNKRSRSDNNTLVKNNTERKAKRANDRISHNSNNKKSNNKDSRFNETRTNLTVLPPAANTREFFERNRTRSKSRYTRSNANGDNNNNNKKIYKENEFNRFDRRNNARRRWEKKEINEFYKKEY